MEIKNPMTYLRRLRNSPGGIEIALAFLIAVVDLMVVRRTSPDVIAVIFGGLQIALVALAAHRPLFATIAMPASAVAFAFLPAYQTPLQILFPLLVVEVMRANGHKLPADITAILLWLISNYDAQEGSFARDGVATAVTTLLFVISYAIGQVRHQSKTQREQAAFEAAEALQQQRLELATVLHDSTAKSFTRVTMLAQALAIEYEDEDAAITEPLADIAETSCEGLLQLRQLLSLLKSAEDDTSLSSALGQDERVPTINQVLEQASTELEQAGFSASLRTKISIEPSLTQISEVIEPAVSEICTNIEKYAEPRSTVRILATGNNKDGFSLTIRNQIARTLPKLLPRAVLSSGLGLSSLNRRVRPLSGSVETEREGNTWSTIVRLPPPRNAPGKESAAPV